MIRNEVTIVMQSWRLKNGRFRIDEDPEGTTTRGMDSIWILVSVNP